MIIKTFLALLTVLTPTHAISSELLFEQSPYPVQAEAFTEALVPWETPIEGFFVRSHFGVPQIDEATWTLTLEGLVEHPLVLKLADLKKLPRQSFHAVLECSGNGRGQFKPPTPGVQWQKGAVGNAEWTGVSLAAILKKAGVKANARFVTVEGGDTPPQNVPKFIRSIPIAKALQENTLLAWGMNRQAIPPAHGGPIRLVLPGWYGETWTKWLTHITLTEEESPNFYMKKGYRMPKTPVKPGEKWDSSTGKPIEELLVQSFVVEPKANQVLPPGKVIVKGKAFSGSGSIQQVQVSSDQGKSWTPAKVEALHPSGGWQEFSASLQVQQLGPLVLWSKASDSAGHEQPTKLQWNPGGYLKNSVDSVTVVVGKKGNVQSATAPIAMRTLVKRKPSLEAERVLTFKCAACHARELIDSQTLTAVQWEGVLKKMEGFGVRLEPDERRVLLNYLNRSR